LKAVNPPKAGERVVLYIDDVGRYEGQVIRASKHHFAVDYRGRRTKTNRAADSLTYALNSKHVRLNRRANPRIRQDQPAVLTLDNGESIACEILDISLTGASIAVSPKPALGAAVSIGRMAAKVVRVHEKGVGVVFTGLAGKMEEVLEKTKATGAERREAGAPPAFGKKGSP
jgi:hypothetical protein